MSETVTLEIRLAHPVETVWDALTRPEQMGRWMFFDAREFRAVAGHRFLLHSPPGQNWNGVIEGTVLEVDPPHRLVYSWVGGPEGQRVETTVTWTLTRDGVDTVLHLEQAGFDAAARREIGGARYGWSRMLEQLGQVLGGAPAPEPVS